MTPTEEQIGQAYRLGRLAGNAGRIDCPFNANGTPDERVMARYWVKGRLDAGGDPMDDDEVEEVERAAGHDTTPGNDELHHYWTRGEGLARWRTSPHPWTTLVTLLTEHVGPQKAKVFASKWFREVFGYWSGERKGKNPVGPG